MQVDGTDSARQGLVPCTCRGLAVGLAVGCKVLQKEIGVCDDGEILVGTDFDCVDQYPT
jgi:hypothetical protein